MTSEKSKALTPFDIVMAIEPPVLDTYVASLVMRTVFEAIGKKQKDGAYRLEQDEHEQLVRVVGDLMAEVAKLKKVYDGIEPNAGRDPS